MKNTVQLTGSAITETSVAALDAPPVHVKEVTTLSPQAPILVEASVTERDSACSYFLRVSFERKPVNFGC